MAHEWTANGRLSEPPAPAGIAAPDGGDVSRLVRILAFLGGLIVLTILIIQSGPALLLANLRSAGWVIGPLVLLWSITYACNARAWQLLVPDRPPEFTFGRAFLLTVTGFGINYATPWLSVGGEPLKVAGSSPWLGHHRAVGSVVGFRFLHAVSHLIVFLLAIVPAAILLPHTPLILGGLAIAAVVLSGTALFLLSQHREGIFERGVALLYRLGPLKRVAARLERHRETMQGLDAELTAVHRAGGGHFAGALAIELLGRLTCTFEYAIILYGMGLGMDLWRGFVIANVSSLITNLFFFVPFEMGSKEGGSYAIFSLLGLAPALGTSAALLSRMREMVWMLIGVVCVLLSGPAKRTAPVD
jgi:hypothetical protein